MLDFSKSIEWADKENAFIFETGKFLFISANKIILSKLIFYGKPKC